LQSPNPGWQLFFITATTKAVLAKTVAFFTSFTRESKGTTTTRNCGNSLDKSVMRKGDAVETIEHILIGCKVERKERTNNTGQFLAEHAHHTQPPLLSFFQELGRDDSSGTLQAASNTARLSKTIHASDVARMGQTTST
jgi:hypothetical protein